MNKITFEAWYQMVDREIISRAGLSRDDLPDCCYHDWYDDGISPKSAARKAIKNAKDDY